MFHFTVRAVPGDPKIAGEMWKPITQEVMHRTGLSLRGEEDDGVRWAAVDHGDQHVHIVAALARQDGRPVRLHNNYYRIAEALTGVKQEHGLRVAAQADRTAPKRPTRAEQRKAVSAGQEEPARVVLRRAVETADAAGRTEREFLEGLAARGIEVYLRADTRGGEATGYAVHLPGDLNAAGGPVWFSGRRLAADLTLPKLRRRWAGTGGSGRLSGAGMSTAVARAVLRREIFRVAAAAHNEDAFFHGLVHAGLEVSSERVPSGKSPAGYEVSLPDLVGHDGQQEWVDGGELDGQLELGQLRAKWLSGSAGAASSADGFDGVDAQQIREYVAYVASWAADQLRAGGEGLDDVASAAAGIFAAAADRIAHPMLRLAADSSARAGRAQWGRVPETTPGEGYCEPPPTCWHPAGGSGRPSRGPARGCSRRWEHSLTCSPWSDRGRVSCSRPMLRTTPARRSPPALTPNSMYL